MSEICHHWKCQKTIHLILIWICKLNQVILNELSVLVNRYELFRKVNDSDTEGVVIKRPRFQNGDILITDYTNINTSTIIPPVKFYNPY